MVKRVLSITALGRSGIADWLLQRVSAVIILFYSLFLLAFYFSHQPIDFAVWHGLFAHTSMKVFSFMALLALLAHAWIGMWAVFTDYIKCAYFRGTIQLLVIIMFLACLAWGMQIFWG
jgi:succinate dehydrogenase / fumarate reductase, membrane anchor subunit